MKKSDLYREWARVLDMCEGSTVIPDDCWKLNGRLQHTSPNFNWAINSYDLAVAILEDKPVFVGDVFYEGGGNKCTIKDDMHLYVNEHCLVQHVENVEWLKFSWNPPPPKKTFELNGVDVPCPIMISHKNILELKANNTHCFFYFDTVSDADKCRSVLFKILTENTK